MSADRRPADAPLDRRGGRNETAHSADPFERLRQLPANWDSYGAGPLDGPTIDRAQLFLARANIMATAAGGVQLEWHTHGFDLEIDFTPDGKTLVLLSIVAAAEPPR